MGHHQHNHGASHAEPDYTRAFAVGVALNVAYIVAEVVFGLATGSLALLADAGHNLSDVLGLLLAWGAVCLGKLRPTLRRTYGWHSSSLLAAMLNAVLLLVVTGGSAWEAIRRLADPAEIPGRTVMLVAGIGVIVNSATALLFVRGRKEDLNIKGAFLHMAADAIISAGVVLGGLGIATLQWLWLDPALSLMIALVILYGTWDLFKESVNLVLHAVPAGIDVVAVTEYLASLPGVIELHDLHIWAMSTTETALTAHLVKPDAHNDDAFLASTVHELHDRFGIRHATIQIERAHAGSNCHLASPDVV